MACYLEADVTPVRVIIAALALCTGVGVALYRRLVSGRRGRQDQPIAKIWIADQSNRSR